MQQKAVMIGGKGKVGTYLIPMLLQAGYEVVNISRGNAQPFIQQACWQDVQQLSLDRKADEAAFNRAIAEQQADVVIDMICFRAEEMERLTQQLQGNTGHYLVCGSVWMHGPSTTVPYAEHMDRQPIGTYGICKHQMDLAIGRLYAKDGFPGTIVHPGHIVGPGHIPVNPQGNQDLSVFAALKEGKPVILPNMGMETLHHVHAQDVAGVFFAAINARSTAYGQGFHAVSPQAVTLRGYAQQVAQWFGKEAILQYMPYEQWARTVPEQVAAATLDHISHSPNASMEKAKRLLGFAPRYTSLQAIRESVDWLLEHDRL